MSAIDYKCCTLCPRECKADRTTSVGFCGMTDKLTVAKVMVHTSEEPCVSGTRGSGAVFFSGCTLRCAFCQNHQISHERFGREISTLRLSNIMLELQDKGVHNINLVSASHFYPSVAESLEIIKEKLDIPVVWNTGGYEKLDAIDRIGEYCDVYLQDLKFYSRELSQKYALCKDYFEHAITSTKKMVEQKGKPVIDDEGIIKSGVILRHLVLPSNRRDSIALLDRLADSVGCDNIILSLMSQYTPPSFDTGYRELGRRLTDFEYSSVCEYAIKLGFDGYFQDRLSAQSTYTPTFDLEGV